MEGKSLNPITKYIIINFPLKIFDQLQTSKLHNYIIIENIL